MAPQTPSINAHECGHCRRDRIYFDPTLELETDPRHPALEPFRPGVPTQGEGA